MAELIPAGMARVRGVRGLTISMRLVVRFVSPYQVKLTAAGKALVNREAARIAWDEDSSKLVPDAAGAGCD